ncbi:SE1561 family protein [Thalassobacillus devorans]|uniref:SE1561 family protein n=1 Tax=Thalassobacillus devorans TaxID=279813 RepID=UPI0004919121|nr:SE1561 family protein [Thalassobacillus devorans]
MGKATEKSNEQFRYLKNRIKMLHEVASSMDEENSGAAELKHLAGMVKDLEIKIERFRKDWEEDLSS